MKSIITFFGLIVLCMFLVSCEDKTTTIISSKENDVNNDNNEKEKKEELYSLTGRASDMFDNNIPGVQITLTGQGITKSTTTNSNGNYSFSNLKEGNYTVKAEKERYAPVFNEGVSERYINGDDKVNFMFYELIQKKDIQLIAKEDTCLDERHPEKIYGDSDILYTGYDDLRNAEGNPQKGKIYNKYALIRFDISQIPTDAYIVSATLTLGTRYSSNTNSSVFVALINSCPRGNWSENSASIQDIPTDLTLIDIQTNRYQASHNYFWNVTEAIKKWINESHPNYGFRIHSTNNESIHDSCSFASREYSVGGGPTLRIVYEL